jgi:hypothetical protein
MRGALTGGEELKLACDGEWLTQVGREEALGTLRNFVQEERIEAARILAPRILERWPDDAAARHWARVLAPPVTHPAEGRSARPRDREFEWLREHRHKHPGCWLAVYEDHLVIADPSLAVVHHAVRETVPNGEAYICFQPRP